MTNPSCSQILKPRNLQHFANNLPDAFTDYNGVTKSLNPAVIAPSRVEVPRKTIQPSSQPKRVRAAKQDKASTKRQRKERNIRSSKSVNESQQLVDGHQVDTVHLKGKCAFGPFLSILVIECQHKCFCVNLCKVVDKVQI
jgi:hypothetical protein